MLSMDLLLFLFRVAIGFGLCYIIYKIIIKFQEAIKAHEVYMICLNAIQDCTEITQEKPQDDDSIYDKSDEELIEDWNNLWGGNPPCELDIKAIREEERREKENQNKE